jgi:hypothetical protein
LSWRKKRADARVNRKTSDKLKRLSDSRRQLQRSTIEDRRRAALCDELESKLRQAEADSEELMNAAVQHVLVSISDPSNTTLVGASA